MTIRASKMLNLILSSLVNIFTSVTLMDKTVLYFSSLYIWDLNLYYITVSVHRKYSATLMDKSAQSQQKPPTKISTNNCTLLFLSICLGCWVAESLSMHTFETIYLSGVLQFWQSTGYSTKDEGNNCSSNESDACVLYY